MVTHFETNYFNCRYSRTIEDIMAPFYDKSTQTFYSQGLQHVIVPKKI